MRRSQAEIIGVAVIVVLLIIGLMFYVLLSSKSNQQIGPYKVREARDFGTALESAMLETTVEGCGYDLSVALQKCAQASYVKCGSETVCQKAKEAIKEMLNGVLKNRGYSYYAEVRRGENPLKANGERFIFGDCDVDASMIYASPVATVGLVGGHIEFEISFCE